MGSRTHIGQGCLRSLFPPRSAQAPNRSRVLFPARLARLRGAKKITGSTAVEMALIAPIFFMFLMGMVEVTMMLTAQQLLENASYNTSRLAKTGFSNTGQTQGQTVSQVLTTELQSFGTFIDTTKVTMTEVAYGTFAGISGGGGANGFGNAQQIVVYTINYPWKFMTPMLGQILGGQDANGNWVVNLTSRIVVRNEPY